MDYKQFRRHMAERMGRSVTDIDSLTEGLGIVISQVCSELDSVAIPTFGTFIPVKHDESISNDLSSGKKMLLPPEIKIEFNPGAMLLKRMRHE